MKTIYRDTVNKLHEDIQNTVSNYIELSSTFEIPDYEILVGLLYTVHDLLLFIKLKAPALVDLLIERLGKNDISAGRG